MSKKFKSQASSARAASSFAGFGTFQTAASPLSYVAEQPDLSQISQPNVVVSLKNLSKKDGTTKAKALDELLESLHEDADVAVLTAWSDLYPRLSIDNSQIVRRSAHSLQGTLTVNAGKRIVPYLPKIIPSWLAGTFDSDKSVAKTATDALDKSFTTDEKKAALWKLYKDSIHSRVEDALLFQSANTLSDERTTSPDEAQSKYVRVVGTAVRLLSHLVTNELVSHEILSEKKLWELVYHDDSYLRTSICGLLRTVLHSGVKDLDWSLLSTCFLYKGLNKSQVGSMQAFVMAVYDLSRSHAPVWTSDYSAKTPVSKRLLSFLRQGSQNGPRNVWSVLTSWIENGIPLEAWRHDANDGAVLIDAYRVGVVQERVNSDAAWASYLDVAAVLLKQLDTEASQNDFAERYLLPVVTSYVTKSTDEKWRIGSMPDKTAKKALLVMDRMANATYQKTWETCTDSVIEKIRLSLPESSKDFRLSQDAAAAQANRLLGLQKNVTPTDFIRNANRNLLHAAIDLLKSRNGKPYGAAVVIEDVVRVGGLDNDERLRDFLEKHSKTFLDSPSSAQLVSLSMACNVDVGAELLSLNTDAANVTRATEYFLQHASESQLDGAQTNELLLSKVGHFETETSRLLALSLLANPQLQQHKLRFQILDRLVSVLSDANEAQYGLSMLETLSAQSSLAQDVSKSEFGPQLSTKLFLLADTEPSLADRASAIATALTSTGNMSASSLPIVRQQLSGEGESLSILTLTDLGLKSLEHVDPHKLLPTSRDWQLAMEPHFHIETQRSLAITSPLRGTVWMVEPGVQQTPLTEISWSKEISAIVRDAEDFSQLFRLAFFVVKVFGPNIGKLSEVSAASQDDSLLHSLHFWLPIALELINEKLTLDEANAIWLGSTDEVLQAASDVLSEGLEIVASWLDNDDFVQDWLNIGSSLGEVDRCTYLSALAFQRIVSGLLDTRRSEVLQKFGSSLESIYKSTNVVQSAALLSVLGTHVLNTQSGLKITNEFVSHITQSPGDYAQLILANVLLRDDASVLEKIPQQRMVFLFKSLIAQIQNPRSATILSESLLLISLVIHHVQDIYGEHWEQLLQGIVSVWSNSRAHDVPVIHSSLQAYAALKTCLRSDEVNDDLQEAWSANKQEIDNALLLCLQALNTSSMEVDQPRSITAEFLRRRLAGVTIPESVDLYDLLSSGLPAIRQAAYEILHRSIPEKQEELSIEVALEDRLAELPKELLQLINDRSDAQRYLLSWKLMFDHYPNASFKLRENYTANIKGVVGVSALLDFFCERFRIVSGRPIDASKFNIKDYDTNLVESEEQNLQWLSVHVYYLLLMYLPSLTKDWYLEQKNRIKAPLENWTQKYLSPLIISSSLAAVNEWSEAQSKELSEADRPVQLKITATEVIASIPIDPESPPIALAISLPSAYPLESPSVTSRTRVGVSDKNWQSWLRTFSVIIFSQGIVEGLVAFRRNVTGALKGQSECAICYSIIGTDMQTPNKKCQTCKNWFHGSCLFRWFRSSNSSSCPLCRNNFNYA